jgi:hypothetical protein
MHLPQTVYQLLAKLQLTRFTQLFPEYYCYVPKVENQTTLVLSCPGSQCGNLIVNSNVILKRANIILGVSKLVIFDLSLLQRIFSLELSIVSEAKAMDSSNAAVLEQLDTTEISQEREYSVPTSTTSGMDYVAIGKLPDGLVTPEEIAQIDGLIRVAQIGLLAPRNAVLELKDRQLDKVNRGFEEVLGDSEYSEYAGSSRKRGRRQATASNEPKEFRPKVPRDFARGQTDNGTVLKLIRSQRKDKWEETLQFLQSGSGDAMKVLTKAAASLISKKRPKPAAIAETLLQEAQNITMDDVRSTSGKDAVTSEGE